MSWQALNWAADQKTGSPQAKLLLLLLANRADENGICWPSQLTLAEQAEQSDDTVQRHLKNMEGRFIARARTKRTKGRWPGYVYQLLMPSVSGSPAEDLPEEPSKKRIAHEAVRASMIRRSAENAEAQPSQFLQNGEMPLVSAPVENLSKPVTTPLSAARTTPLSAVSPGRSQRCHQAAESGVEPSIEPPLETSVAEPPRATATAPPALRPRAVRGTKPIRLDVIHNQIAQRLGSQGYSILQSLSPKQLAQIEGMQRNGSLTDVVLHELRTEAAMRSGQTNL